jgi:hypothetical protein
MTSIQYMDSETVSQVQHRVDHEVRSLDDKGSLRTELEEERFAYLCDVAQSLDQVVGFLNGEYAAFKEGSRA